MPQEVSSPTSSSKQMQLRGQTRLLRVTSSQVLTTSRIEMAQLLWATCSVGRQPSWQGRGVKNGFPDTQPESLLFSMHCLLPLPPHVATNSPRHPEPTHLPVCNNSDTRTLLETRIKSLAEAEVNSVHFSPLTYCSSHFTLQMATRWVRRASSRLNPC